LVLCFAIQYSLAEIDGQHQQQQHQQQQIQMQQQQHQLQLQQQQMQQMQQQGSTINAGMQRPNNSDNQDQHTQHQ
jgi:hypothetical protein